MAVSGWLCWGKVKRLDTLQLHFREVSGNVVHQQQDWPVLLLLDMTVEVVAPLREQVPRHPCLLIVGILHIGILVEVSEASWIGTFPNYQWLYVIRAICINTEGKNDPVLKLFGSMLRALCQRFAGWYSEEKSCFIDVIDVCWFILTKGLLERDACNGYNARVD